MNTFLICLNIALTLCTSFLVTRAICLIIKLEKAVRVEGEITQDDMGDLKEELRGLREKLKAL